jgi:pyruvate dehydrogenase E2 component (dihydrolipoamide acetyltransferase)
MPVDVIMPKVDMDQENGTVRAWLKANGDAVQAGETILEIETDKVAIEVEAPATGILDGILVHEGETVPIATTIAYILAPGESLPAAAAPKREGPGHKAPRLPDPPVATAAVASTPVARKVAEEAGVDITAVSGSGPRGRVTRKDVEQALAHTPGAGPRPYATPAARRVAAAAGLDLAELAGSGPDGRIQETDVLRASTAAAATTTEIVEYTAMPLQGIRRTIAERLTTAAQTIPHIHFTQPIDMTRFEQTRAELNAHAEANGGPRVSATALLVKLVAASLAQHPQLNSHLVDDEIRLFKSAHIGMAVALDEGLIVPVIHDAGQKGVGILATEVRDLAARAKAGKLTPADVRGGTFTISNLGPYGIEQFTAIINPPQTAILAVGATKPEVVPDAKGNVSVKPIMRVTLAADHRVIDGAVAAAFLAGLKTIMESPTLMLW